MSDIRSIKLQLPTAEEGRGWFAFRTMFKREKLVAKRLRAKGIEAYVPIKTEVRYYKSKTTTVDLPLFSSYAFAKIYAEEYAAVLNDPDVFEIVHFDGEIGRVTEAEIDFLKVILNDTTEGFAPVQTETLAVGSPVVITGGTLAGTRGIISDEPSNNNFVVELKTLGISLGITVDARLIAPAP